MNSKKFSEAMNELDDKYIEKAANYQAKKRKPVWIKRGAVAACLCLIIGLGIIIPSMLQEKPPELLSTGAHLELISVELVEWQDNGFKAIVTDTGNSSLFPVEAKLTVIFRENNTEIVLDDGSSYGYGEIQIDDVEWSSGTIIDIGFGVYEKYEAEKEYENKVYAYHVKAATIADTTN